jgi:hypothetical protein
VETKAVGARSAANKFHAIKGKFSSSFDHHRICSFERQETISKVKVVSAGIREPSGARERKQFATRLQRTKLADMQEEKRYIYSNSVQRRLAKCVHMP